MPSINLINARREEKKRVERQTRQVGYAIAGEIGALVLAASFLSLRMMTIHQQIGNLNAEIGRLEPKVNEIQELQAKTALLQPKLTVLNEARNNTLYWYTALQTVVACLPERAWLSDFSTSGDPTPPPPAPTNSVAAASGSAGTVQAAASATTGASLALTGTAATSDAVGAAMARMNQYANIASVTLGSLNQVAQGSAATPMMSFTLQVQLKPDTSQDVTTPGFEPSSAAGRAVATLPSPAHAPIPARMRQASIIRSAANSHV